VYFPYILQGETDVGQTQDVPERLAHHNANYSNL